jgi:hypothetical protein
LILPDSPRRHTVLPLVPHNFKLVGDAAADARAAAVTARNAAMAKYEPDNYQLGQDIGQYNTDNAYWTANGAGIPEPDHTNCFNALAGAYSSLDTENVKIGNAYDHIGAGDTNLTNGDNNGNPQMKIMFYNTAKSHYDTAASRCTDAENAHASFVTYISTAEAILY